MRFAPLFKYSPVRRILPLVLLVSVLLISGAAYAMMYGGVLSQTIFTMSNHIRKGGAESQAATPTISSIQPDYALLPSLDGLAPVLYSIPTKQPVVFLGIDDGIVKQSMDLEIMRSNHVRASLFLDDSAIRDNLAFFNGYLAQGSRIENHTVNHKLLTRLSYTDQKYEICTEADLLEQEYGRRPTLFRPPGGEYNIDTRRAAAACGMKAIIMWKAKANGGSMQYQEGDRLRPGDIVLMHFRKEFHQDMQAFLQAQKSAGLQVQLLEDWL